MQLNYNFPFTDNASEGLLQIIDYAPSPILIVDEANTIVWMNTTAHTLLHKNTTDNDYKEKYKDKDVDAWDRLIFPIVPGIPLPSELLTSPDYQHINTMGPFKVLLQNDTGAQLELRKVTLGTKTYACCYVSPDADSGQQRYVRASNNVCE
jgi:hypothetical protein